MAAALVVVGCDDECAGHLRSDEVLLDEAVRWAMVGLLLGFLFGLALARWVAVAVELLVVDAEVSVFVVHQLFYEGLWDEFGARVGLVDVG